MGAQRKMSVEAAVRRELRSLAGVDRRAAESGQAATALALAKRIDDPETSAAATASCARALVLVLDELRLRGMPKAPAAEKGDRLDELTTRRQERLAKPKAAARKRKASR